MPIPRAPVSQLDLGDQRASLFLLVLMRPRKNSPAVTSPECGVPGVGSGRLEGVALERLLPPVSALLLDIPAEHAQEAQTGVVFTPVGLGRAFEWLRAPHLVPGPVLSHCTFTPARSVQAPFHR